MTIPKNTATYHIVPINTSAIEEDRGIIWCRDATIKRIEGLDEQIVSVKICRDKERWYIKNI